MIRKDEITDFFQYKDMFGLFLYKKEVYLLFRWFCIQIGVIKDSKYKNIISKDPNKISNAYNAMKNLYIDNVSENLRYKIPESIINLDELNNEHYIFIFKIYYFQ